MSAAPGWYDDGQHEGRLRYWDGAIWTDHFVTKPVPGGSDAPADSADSARIVEFDVEHRPLHASSRRRVVWPWLAPLLVIGAAGATVLALWSAGGLTWAPSPLG